MIQKRTDNVGDDGCEDWEDDYELISKGDYKGLKKLRQIIAKNNPEDIYAQWRLGEAWASTQRPCYVWKTCTARSRL